MRKIIERLAGAAVAFAALSAGAALAADEELIQVTCDKGEVTATGVAPWHTNAHAPWTWDKGKKVAVDETTAKFKGAKCAGNLTGYVCAGEKCKGPIKVAVK